jgi:shikimate kinase
MILPIADSNLILTGYTGPNQPPVGRLAAARLGRRFVNIDTLVEDRAGMSLDEIRAAFGASRLKTLETEIVLEAALYRDTVIRVGGQTLLHSGHYDRLAATGPVICLVAALDAVLQRQHLALGARYHDPNERAFAVGHLKREWAARHLPGIHVIDTTYMTEEEMIEAVILRWRELVI